MKELSGGGSSRSERNETLMCEYIYFIACTTLSPVCLSVIPSTRSLNSIPHSCSISDPRRTPDPLFGWGGYTSPHPFPITSTLSTPTASRSRRLVLSPHTIHYLFNHWQHYTNNHATTIKFNADNLEYKFVNHILFMSVRLRVSAAYTTVSYI